MVDATATVHADGNAAIANPLRAGLQSDRIADPCSIVFFGASGDLFKRMLLPAMYSLRSRGILPNDFALVGVSATAMTDDEFRAYCKAQLDLFAAPGQKAQGAIWDDFARRLSYISAQFGDAKSYGQLAKKLADNDANFGTKQNRLYYLSTPPPLFHTIIDNLKEADLNSHEGAEGWSRIIIEKPFGTDLDSARALQTTVDRAFKETEVYRIDHFLGKEPVQDIMALRFANTIFEPVWNRNYVESVQITASEQLGVELRGGYYDNAGALRDMIQNHVMNLLALVAMEPPTGPDADAIRSEKFKVLQAIEPPTWMQVKSMSARGQYGEGAIDGKPVPAYRSEPDVSPTSNTETFAALKLYVENWRWAGVPFYLRSGKRLAKKISEIAVTFKPIPHKIYGEATDAIEPNVLVMKIQPDEGVAMRFSAKVPGLKSHIRSVFMDFNYGSGFGVQSPPAYERLIGDAMRGDQTLFTRWDAVERAWEIVMPVLQVWQREKDQSFPNYASGSQGPESAAKLFPGWRSL
ncbi:MAG TPA: glucose-6-phosphate dehydrogenase [Candidatus Baltobacteraceae bacterium]|nr:glucose-6-phosphate dehydrogenase [Candidatus Baltobacteraceae bacterium]